MDKTEEWKSSTKSWQPKTAMLFGHKHMAGWLGRKHLLELSDSFYRWVPRKQNHFKRNKEEIDMFIVHTVIIIFFCFVFASLTFFFTKK